MSKIDELIQELCPEGVPYFSLDRVFDIRGGFTPSKANTNFWKEGVVPWFRMEDIRTNGRVLNEAIQKVSKEAVKKGGVFEADSIIVATTATIGEHALITTPFLANQQFSILTRCDEYRDSIDPKFAYYVGFSLAQHCLNNTNVSGFASVNMEAFRRFPFPVPPLEVQKEIVSILDKFTQLEAELEAELEARRTQYEVTRGRLLDFSTDLESHPLSKMIMELCPEGVTFGELSDVTLMDAGDRVTKANMSNLGQFDVYGAGTVPTGKLDDWNRENSLIFSRAGAGAGFVNFIPARFWATDVCFVAEQKPAGPLIKFVYYWMKSQQYELMRHTYGGSMPKIDKRYLWTHPVPLPHFEVQKEIVAILDKLDALVNDNKIGLPAEIAARRKQYEYYRNKLLTFKELDAA
jgi:type I restriction enzyme S subunit